MINDINNLNQRPITQDTTLDNRPIVNNSAVQNKDVLLALAKIQIGDILTGKLMQEGQNTMLKLDSGLKLLAQLEAPILADQMQDFLVTGKDKFHIEIEPLQISKLMQSGEQIEDSIIKEMQLPNNENMKELIGQWMDKQLPLIKNQLVQTYQLAKNFDMPTELFTNLKSNELTLNSGEVELIANFKEKGLETLTSTVDDMFEHLNQEETTNLVNDLSNRLSKEDLKNILTSTPLMQNENSKFSKQELEILLRQTFSEEDTDIKPNQDNLLKDLFSNLSKANLKAISKEIIKKYIAVQQDDENQPLEQMKKLEESAKRLKDITNDMKPYVKEKEVEQTIQKFEQTAQVLEKYQQEGQYYCFPLQIKDQDASGELYFFKPKKKKGAQDSGLYIVLALDMPSLKHIEIHLKEQTDALGLRIKVTNDIILKQIEEHKEKLQDLLEETMIPISNILVERLETSIAQKIEQNRKEQIGRLDFRV